MTVHDLSCLQLITYSTSPYYSLMTYMTRTPQPVDRFFNIIHPFSALVWAYMTGSLLAVAMVVWVAYNLYEKVSSLSRWCFAQKSTMLWSFCDIFFCRRCHTSLDFLLLPLGMLLAQPTLPWFPHSPSRVSGSSCLVAAWMLGAFIIAHSFTTTLLASLVAVDLEPPIDTFEELANQFEKKGGEIWIIGVRISIHF